MVKRNEKMKPQPFSEFLDTESLYRGIHKNLFANWPSSTEIYSNIFTTNNTLPDGLSTDWSRYRKPKQTLKALTPPGAIISNAILDISVRGFKSGQKARETLLDVQHNPTIKNPGHTLIVGFKGLGKHNIQKEKVFLSKISSWAAGFAPDSSWFNMIQTP